MAANATETAVSSNMNALFCCDEGIMVFEKRSGNRSNVRESRGRLDTHAGASATVLGVTEVYSGTMADVPGPSPATVASANRFSRVAEGFLPPNAFQRKAEVSGI